MDRGSEVAVVGGGAAGLTAAVALARRGVSVTLLERLDAVMP
ncbi:MAG: FAD-dependent oxidoreductase, partial [Actinomycetota bacterium]|nr:FAD-dependent oxidoreductase [Actinomycetota bacterium]